MQPHNNATSNVFDKVGYNKSLATKSLAKVVLLTKDESFLIEDFITYYGELFGYENVIVVDNGSTCQAVLDVYEWYSSTRGVQIKLDKRDFSSANVFMSEHMREVASSCEWILPLETDEFVFSMRSANDPLFRLRPVDVRVYLESLPEDVSIVNYWSVLGSSVDPNDDTDDLSRGMYPRPTTNITRFKNQNWDKLIVRASEFLHMKMWCHQATVKTGCKVRSHFLGLLHFPETGFRRKVESAVRVLRTFPYIVNIRDINEEQSIKEVRRNHTECQKYIELGVLCGHKIEYYDVFFRRLLALRAFRDVLGRNPVDPDDPDPESAILRKRLNMNPTMNSNLDRAIVDWSWEALLYNDFPSKHSSASKGGESVYYENYQVANFFKHVERKISVFFEPQSEASYQQSLPPSFYATFEEAMRSHKSLKSSVHAYAPLYTILFDPFRENDSLEGILEIGVQQAGAFANALSSFFPDAAVVDIPTTP
eukprot:gene11741-biopygen3876